MPCLIRLARSMVNRFNLVNLVMQMNLFMMITHVVIFMQIGEKYKTHETI